jgi:two-component system sensor kinase FixL
MSTLQEDCRSAATHPADAPGFLEQRAGILDALPAQIALLDARGVIFAVNGAWRRVAEAGGAGENAHLGADYLAACRNAAHSGESTAIQALAGLNAVMGGNLPRLELDYPCLMPDGARSWFRMIAAPLRAAGERNGAVVMHMDITALKQTQASLEEREARLQSILETLPDALLITDEAGRIDSLSAAAERMFGWTAAELVGQDIAVLAANTAGPAEGAALLAQLRAGQARVLSGRRRHGAVFPLELQLGEAESGGDKLLTLFARDLTDRRATEARLQSLQAESLHVLRLREAGAMVSALAHELNQPLTSCITALGAARRLMDRPEQEAALRESIGLAADQAWRAGQILQNLRGFLSRGAPERQNESVPRLIETASALALAGTGESGIHLTVSLDPGLPPVFIDRVQMQQVLVNLMRNAVQAMSEGESATLSLCAMLNADGEVEIAVTDTGPGLPADIAAHLFEPFRTTKPNGMGVGLAICRSIVEAHGGHIWAEPNPLGGTIFRLTLPAAAGSTQELQAPP